MGKVYLIGGGPGREDLITVRAVKALEKCTAILYDRLSGEGVLKYVNKDAKLFYCGKEPGCHYKTQEEINEIIIKLAKEGHIVGRIKGGDPYIFGRGGEEALDLIKENISFEVIPGITSPIAALNYGGIPVTHRKIAQSFHVFTGKSAQGVNLDFEVISKLKGTLIFMMSYENLSLIASGLINAGKNEATPAAVVMKGTTYEQKKAVGTLANITEEAKKNNLSNPAIIVVGDVVNFHDKLNWFEEKPLFGRNICVTRTIEQSVEISEELRELGAEVTEINSIAIKANLDELKPLLPKLSQYDYVVFTSVNGVKNFFNALIKYKIDVRKMKGEFISIGNATTKELELKGIIPLVTAEEFTAEGLFEAMKDKVKSGDKILIPRSKQGRTYLVEELNKLGVNVDDLHIYDTVLGENHNLGSFKNCDTVLFTSPSTVRNMISLVGIEEIMKKIVISIGPITAKELDKNEISYIMCDEPNNNGIIKKLLSNKN